MYNEKLIPLFTEDEGGKTIPWEGLTENNFKFKRPDTQERIYFSTFNDAGEGCYIFSGWQTMVGGILTDLTDIQPVWIYIDNEPYYRKGVFYVGDAEFHFALKSVVDNLSTAVANKVSKTGDENIAGNKTFTGHIGAGFIDNTGPYMYIGTNTGKVFIGNAQFGTPLSMGAPMYGNSMTTKNWVNTEITNRLGTLLEGNYQESTHIVRIIPEGLATPNQVYINWLTALLYGLNIVNSVRQLTVLVAGTNEDVEGVVLDFYEYDLNNHYYTCIVDYVHFKGLHSNSKILSNGNISYPGYHFKAGALGRVIMEDLYFYFDNDGQTGDIENIVFKNCKFESKGGSISFINCQFLGTNNFISTTANEFTFTTCTGNLLGISEISAATPYETMTKKYNPKLLAIQHTFSESITRTNASVESFFLDLDNDNKLTFKDAYGNYYVIQESPNLIRVIPNGVTIPGQVYLNWLNALVYGNGYVSSTKLLTALICGFGTSGASISMDLYEISTGVYSYVRDYMHWKGIGSGIKVVANGNFASNGNRFEAGAIDRIRMENLDFYFNDDQQSGEIKNIVFKDCSFESLAIITFTDCRFEGKNYIKSGSFTFNNCTGTPIYSEVDLTISGTNKIPYETPIKKVATQFSTEQLVFSGTERGVSAEQNSIFLDQDNGNLLSFKDDDDAVFTIDLTAT